MNRNVYFIKTLTGARELPMSVMHAQRMYLKQLYSTKHML